MAAIRTLTSISTGEWVSNNPVETFNLGALIGEQLQGGEVLLLSGPLGAGKTIFVKGLASSLGLDPEEITSPSFTLVNPYQGRLPVYHIDLYRLDTGLQAGHAVDLDELLREENAVIVIEWAERLANYPLPSTQWQIVIEGDGDAARRIRILTEISSEGQN